MPVMAVAIDTLRRYLDLYVDTLDESVSGSDLAARAFLSRYHFDRVLRAAIGEPPGALRRRLLLERAAWRLIQGRTSATDEAFDAGYGSLGAFTRAFARAFGTTPSKYRAVRGTARDANWRVHQSVAKGARLIAPSMTDRGHDCSWPRRPRTAGGPRDHRRRGGGRAVAWHDAVVRAPLRLGVVVALVVAACGGAATPQAAQPSPTAGLGQPTSSGTSGPGSPWPTETSRPTSADWPVYHRDPARTGNDPAFPALEALTTRWSAPLDGAVYAEPLVVGGRVIAATEGGSVYALDADTGQVVWRQNLGTPVPLSQLPCGNIDPLGITGTPAYDPSTGSLFLGAEVVGPRHVLFALDATDGTVRWSRAIDQAGDDPSAYQQRAALALGNGSVYVGLGGLFGDCGQYRGELIGVPVTGDGPTIAYRVPTEREGAIWAAGGPALDPSGNLHVSVGNGSSTTTYDGSDSVLELSPKLELLSSFAPSTWAADNAADADLGSLSPVLVPGRWVFIAGKSGIGYVLRQGALGGIGGEVASAPLCAAYGGSAQDGATLFVPCSNGLIEVRIGSDGSIERGWQTSSGANGSPVLGGGAVWSLDVGSGELFALDPASGAARARVSVGPVSRFASPTLWRDEVLVGTTTGITAVAVR